MRIRVIWFLCACIAVAWATWPSIVLAQSGPRQTVERADLRIRALLEAEVSQGSAEATRRDEQLREAVDELLDIDHMARNALGEHWQRTSEDQRREYRALLGQLIERAYLDLARDRVTYQIQYGSLSVDRDRAWVETLLLVAPDPRGPTFQVVFVMVRRDGRWRVRELITDGVHLVGSYRVQFTRLIRHRGFDELLRRMRARLQSGEP